MATDDCNRPPGVLALSDDEPPSVARLDELLRRFSEAITRAEAAATTLKACKTPENGEYSIKILRRSLEDLTGVHVELELAIQRLRGAKHG